MMSWSLSGAIDASFEDLNRALFSVGVILLVFGLGLAIALILKLNPIPSVFEWPILLTFIPMLVGGVMLTVGAYRWHTYDKREQEFKNFVMDSIQKEQTGTVEIDGETIAIEAEIGMEEDDE